MRGVYYRTEKDGTPLATPELRISATNNRTVYYDNQNAKEAALQNDEIKEGSIVLTGYADGESEVVIKQQPDWENVVQITGAQLETGYVCPSDGMIVGYSYVSNADGVWEITVNSVTVSSCWRANPAYSFLNIQCQVNKDDLVKSERLMNVCLISFVPFKTVAEPLTLPVNVNVVPENNKYLYTEVKTNKTWVDGRPIYRQCILVNTTSSSSSATEATINASTTYPYIDQIISATQINSSQNRIINPNGVRMVNNTIRVYAGAYGIPVGDTLILEYVK